MKTLQLQNNIEGAEIEEIEVSNKDFKTLESFQYAGGFLRFNMCILSDEGKGKTNKQKLLPFLHSVFIINKELINLYF